MNNDLYEWSERSRDVFVDFIESLNENKIRFFILRNYEGLPDINKSKDVDIIIEPNFYLLAKKLLISVFRAHLISNYCIVNYERAHCCFGMDLKKCFSIHIDLIEGYANKGYEILDFNELYANTIKYNDFRVLCAPYDAIMLLLYKLIGCGELKESYREKVEIIYKKENTRIDKILMHVFGRTIGGEIIDFLKNGDFESIISLSKIMGSHAKKRVLLRNPVKTLVGIFKFYSEKFYRMVVCPMSVQKMIAVEAPDGTGKSTFIDNLKIEIAKYFVCDISKTQIYHFRPTFLPNLGAAGEKMGVMKEDKDFTNPHRSKPVGFLNSLCRMSYYWFDYLIGTPFILRKNARFDKFTVFDRYIYDFIVDPHRSRINLPKWIRILFIKFVKEPQIVFVLKASVDTIYSRKQELTKEEISRQLKEFELLAMQGSRFVQIDAEQSPEIMVKQAMQHILRTYTVSIGN